MYFLSKELRHRNFILWNNRWHMISKLKLNPDKTEFIIIGEKHTREALMPKLPTEEVWNLGVTLDSENTFDNHIVKACHTCYHHLRDLR